MLVERAKGFISARDGVDVQQAFERLRGYARDHHRSVQDVAREIMEGRLLLR